MKAGAAGALPVVDDGGAARANLLAAMLVGERVKTSFELQLPVAGEPSLLELVLELNVSCAVMRAQRAPLWLNQRRQPSMPVERQNDRCWGTGPWFRLAIRDVETPALEEGRELQ